MFLILLFVSLYALAYPFTCIGRLVFHRVRDEEKLHERVFIFAVVGTVLYFAAYWAICAIDKAAHGSGEMVELWRTLDTQLYPIWEYSLLVYGAFWVGGIVHFFAAPLSGGSTSLTTEELTALCAARNTRQQAYEDGFWDGFYSGF